MSLKSIFLGIAVTSVLLAVLVATRMMVLTTTSTEYEIREIETVSLPEPPAPPEEVIVPEDQPPPPPPALADLSVTPDLNQPAVPVSPMKIDPRLAVETFFTDQPPSPLPQPSIPRPAVKPKGPSKPSAPVRPKIKAIPKPKSQYSLGELDQKPRLLRNPSVRFPRSIRNAKSGRVVVRVAILPSGRSQFISVISSTHPDLISPARRIANGSRFTPPTHQGKPVKAVMSWPITIKK
jgi:TonB family protein